MRFASPVAAVVRPLSSAYLDCLRTHDAVIDLPLAMAQHRAYCDALAEAGVQLHWAWPEPGCPDACFVEDTAVVLGAEALLTRPGAPSRRPEVPGVAAALSHACRLSALSAPATLDGGDVLRVGDTLYVGRSERTNDAGVAGLRTFAEAQGLQVVVVPLAAGLHLKSVATFLPPHRVVLVVDSVDPACFTSRGVDVVWTAEPAGGNALALGDRVLVSADAPELGLRLVDEGLRVVSLDLTEIHKGDGALTCLSVRLPQPGTWCA